jgi:hypothetical protein
MSGYFWAMYSFSTLIQALRFAAVGPEDTIAHLPLPPICFASASAVASPTALDSAWLTKTSRTESGASVSVVMTLMPASAARLRIGAMAEGSLGATASTSTFCWISEFTISACLAASAVVSPW